MKVQNDTVVKIDYRMEDVDKGHLVEATSESEPLTYLHGHRQILSAVEQALCGLEAGASCELVVAPEEGYGLRDPRGIFAVPKTAFPEPDLATGMQFTAVSPEGRPISFRVVDMQEDFVIVDTNHPLAGHHLRICVTVLEVRAATAQELGHGHVHSLPASN